MKQTAGNFFLAESYIIYHYSVYSFIVIFY